MDNEDGTKAWLGKVMVPHAAHKYGPKEMHEEAEALARQLDEAVEKAHQRASAIAAPADVPVATPILPHSGLPRWQQKLPWFIGGGVFATLLIVWLIGATFVSGYQIGGSKLSARTSDTTLATALHKQAAAYKLPVKYPDGKTHTYALADAGIKLDAAKSVAATKVKHAGVAARLAWWKPTKPQYRFTKDDTAMNAFITQHISVVVQPPQDASLTIEDGQIKLADAVTGKQYGLEKPADTLVAAAATMSSQPIPIKTLNVNPALTQKMLEPYKAKLEAVMNQSAELTVGSKTVTPSPSDIAGWLEITPDIKAGKVDIDVNSGKVAAYIDRVASSSIRPAKAQVETDTPDGKKVLVPGENGINVVGKNNVSTKLADGLLDAKGFNYELPVETEAFKTISTGYYPKWLEADITTKRLYAYEYGNLVATFLSSNGAPATPTVTGQYNIYAKYASQNMSGRNADGSNYYQPNVQWISYFYQDYAVHGNYWRPKSYFGNINSSHGCVGLVNDDAYWVYNWAPIGTPVIVHE